MSAMIRVNALTETGYGNKTLHAMEKHGKRLDETSQMRRVRDVEPLVHGTLDLHAAYKAHMCGVAVNKGTKRPILHALIKFPRNIPVNAQTEKRMLEWAVDFIDRTHGGNAVFAGRLDRDEAGLHVVDVFYAPKYEKVTKTRKGEAVKTWWLSTTRFGKLLCEKHRIEIECRHSEGKFTTGPRQTGIALQSELYDYLCTKGLALTPRSPKTDPWPDRQETEAYKATKDAEARAAFIRSEADRDAARIREAAFAEGYAAGIAAARVEIHELALAVQDTKDTVTAFMQKVAPVLTKRQDALVKPVAAALGKSLDRITDHLDDMSDLDEGSSAGPGF